MDHGAQRASRRKRSGRLAVFATFIAFLALITLPATVGAATYKVVIVVGPVEGMTATYRADANALTTLARSYGASVTRIYSPYATWSRVKAAAQGANVLIYLGHGNGTPSPYPYSPYTKNGMGLNALYGHGNANVKYYGSAYMKYIHLAPNAVVILNHLCYSAGNSEPGRAAPTTTVAKTRIDYYASSFLRTGAKAVFAEPKGTAGYILTGLFRTNLTMGQIFTQHGYAPTRFNSSRTPGATAIARLTVRSVEGFLGTTAADFR